MAWLQYRKLKDAKGYWHYVFVLCFFGATSVATACLIKGTVANDIAVTTYELQQRLDIEHSSGRFTVLLERNSQYEFTKYGFIRTARPIMYGLVMIPSSVWQNIKVTGK
ncbi:PrpF domain-containing protein [Acinetobacter baumannii]|uniref:PrpF domain-containing protein n=1 Tax=Acinetobacter nosocomialis TaxID=106654 RepID=UPI001D0F378B|nr:MULTISPECIES: PrpF domain-containing protein [Acinetobacter calcoaceticus/baumannii complex]MDH2546095.1 PrpF domain-containing protein [Acinetobacter baumannii]MDO7188326.1 PrpF domain-containing protein [Acinetobacter baumannii]MDO7209463.1 PrpF domain-containing protein [Acinetobacter nosocomialis]MDO7231460.1 PrpF domain-containing protein [Acinetobacter nosocomialis]MDV7449446.1 PrpF domain-containing protein [Acinetobacter baumannii]